MERRAAVRHHVFSDGCASRYARLYPGTRTNSARLAHFTDAIDLPAHAQLLHLESDPARDQRRVGELGQTRTHRQRAGAGVACLRLFLFWGVFRPLCVPPLTAAVASSPKLLDRVRWHLRVKHYSIRTE